VLPVNTSGGLLSQGDATGASAVAQLCELSWQLREEAGSRQVAGARTGLALSAYETAANRLAFVSLVILHV
jgi:acetyl-CoA acetyltransferase